MWSRPLNCLCEEAKPTRQSRGLPLRPAMPPTCPGSPRACGPRDDGEWDVIARRRSRRGNPGVYRRARPCRPPALVRHGPAALAMTVPFVIPRRRSRRGNTPTVIARSEATRQSRGLPPRPARPPTCPGSPRACGPRDDGSFCHCEEAKPTRQSRGLPPRSARPPTRPGSPRACGPRDDGSFCHCEEAKPTRQSRALPPRPAMPPTYPGSPRACRPSR
jgi:hypothetical protein